jgi:hypothetical protein
VTQLAVATAKMIVLTTLIMTLPPTIATLALQVIKEDPDITTESELLVRKVNAQKVVQHVLTGIIPIFATSVLTDFMTQTKIQLELLLAKDAIITVLVVLGQLKMNACFAISDISTPFRTLMFPDLATSVTQNVLCV